MDLEELEALFDDELDDPPPLPPPLPDVSSSQLPSHSAPQSTGNDPGTSPDPGPLPPTQPPTHDPNQGPPAKKRKPLLTLKVDRIFSDKGLPYLENEFPKIKFKGKGHEVSDLKLLMKHYEHWGNRLYPKFTFKDLTERIEKLSTKKEFKNQLLEIRRRHAVINNMRQADGASSPSQLEGQDGASPPRLDGEESQPDDQSGPSLQPNDETGPASRTNGWFSDEDEPTHLPDEEMQQRLNGSSGTSQQLGDPNRPPWLDDDNGPRALLLDREEAHSPTPQQDTTQPGLYSAEHQTELVSSLQSDSRQDGRNALFCSGTSEGDVDSPSPDKESQRPNSEKGTSRDERDSDDGMIFNSECFSEDQEAGICTSSKDQEVAASSKETFQEWKGDEAEERNSEESTAKERSGELWDDNMTEYNSNTE